MLGDSTLDADGHVDVVRGDNLSTGEPLPRIAPLRATAGLNWQRGAWGARAEVKACMATGPRAER
jgi:iron complex outermembrane recepter protein